MSRIISQPVAVTHQGRPILFAHFEDTQAQQRGIAYNILDVQITSDHDDQDWTGYRLLPDSPGLAPSGMSVLATPQTPQSEGLLCAASDQEYIYLFVADTHTILCHRYLMVDNPQVGDTTARKILQVPWQVRFQRSRSASVAGGDRDTLGYLDKEQQPFLEPTWQLSFGTGSASTPMNLGEGAFWVNLVPTGSGDELRWQLFLLNQQDKLLYTYSLERAEDGLPQINPSQLDPNTKQLRPDAIITLTLEREGDDPVAAQWCAPPAATVYFKQEPVYSETQGVLRMNQVSRLLLSAQVSFELNNETNYGLSTLDFAINTQGKLALLEPTAPNTPRQLTLSAGAVKPAEYSLDFDGRSAITLDAAQGYVPGSTFTLEAWVYPTHEDLDTHAIIGSEDAAPMIWIQERRRLGIGFTYLDNNQNPVFVSAISDDSILTPHTWNHVAFTYSPEDGARLFHNANALAITGDITPNLTLAASPITRLGQAKDKGALLGLLDEVRAWNITRSAQALRAGMYKEIPEQEAAQNPNLRAYWRLDEGTGTTTTDLAKKGHSGEGYTGTLEGAQWLARTAPMMPSTSAIPHFDEQGLSVNVGVIIPGSGLTERFGALAIGSRPWLLAGSDGLIHCYYQGVNQEALVCQYDTAITRARYAASWQAGPTQGELGQQGSLEFVSRRAGSPGNIAAILIEPDAQDQLLCQITLHEAPTQEHLTALINKTPTAATKTFDAPLITETWRGVPKDTRAIEAILNGSAITDPSDLRASAKAANFFDYTGQLNQALLSQSQAPSPAYLQFVSRLIGALSCTNLNISVTDNEPTCTVTVTLRSDEAHPDESLTRTFAQVPRDVELFLKTINGTSDRYNYNATPALQDTIAYALRTQDSSTTYDSTLQIFVTGEHAPMSFTIAQASSKDSALCNFTVTRGTQSDLWEDIARTSSKLIDAVRQDPKTLGASLRFLPPIQDLLIPDQRQDVQLSSIVFLSFWESFNRGFTGLVQQQDMALNPIQGATSTDERADLVRGSHLFRLISNEQPNNGYPALVNTSAASLPLSKPGIDGGWIAESPRNAVKTSPQGGLIVDTSRDVNVFTSPESITLEAWCSIDTPKVADPGDDFITNPRIIHCNPTDDQTRARYMLGLRATEALMVTQDNAISTSDADQPHRIADTNDYTVQLYILPDLSSTDVTNTIWALAFQGADRVERLRITQTGQAQLVITSGGSDQTVISSTKNLDPKRWSLLTFVRLGGQLKLYIDNSLVGTYDAQAPQSSGASRTFTIADNKTQPTLQFRVSEVAIWNRSRDAQEIVQDARTPVPQDDQALAMLWPLNQNIDREVINRAEVTFGSFNAQIIGQRALWLIGGVFYRAFAAVRDAAVETRDALIAPELWHHLSAIYAPRYGVTLSSSSWADCGADTSLNVEDGLSIAAWIVPSAPSSGIAQAIFGKYGRQEDERSYQLGLDGTGHPQLTVRLDGQRTKSGDEAPENQRQHTFTSPQALSPNVPVQLTATAALVQTVDALSGSTYTSLSAQLYIDGEPTLDGPALRQRATSGEDTQTYALNVIGGTGSGRYQAGEQVHVEVKGPAKFTTWISEVSKNNQSIFAQPNAAKTTLTMPAQDLTVTGVGLKDHIRITQSSAPATIGRVQTKVSRETLNLPYSGVISDLQLWSRPLAADEVASYVATTVLPSSQDGLISYWPFSEQTGLLAADTKQSNDATLTQSSAWVTFHAEAGIELLIDGKVVPLTRASPGTFDGYGQAQLRFAQMLNDFGGESNPLGGQLDELRIWNQVRTHEQITDSMNTYLTGREPGLIGYWRFDVGSGQVVVDRTAYAHDATFNAPSGQSNTWVISTAPISDEASVVRNALGGPQTRSTAHVTSAPAVVEYGDIQRDAQGNLFSVIKRLYLLDNGDELSAVTGFKVGDLDLIYLGQIQTDPTLVGFVEGPPPIPSENLTRPFWMDPTKPSYLAYYNSASVTLNETEGLEVSFGQSSSESTSNAFGASAGISLNFTTEKDIGVAPVQITIQTTYLSGKAGGGVDFDFGEGSNQSSGWGTSLSQGRKFHFYNCGDWERPGDDGQVYLNSDERRFVPNNEGMAVVRSLTADLYSTHLRSNGALVSLSAVPNEDIPEDVNLIYFPINPKYVKNGTLDGRLGLQPDPDYITDTNPDRSYFKPVEAYSIQQQIEARQASLEAYYAQIDATALGKNGTTDLSSQRANNPYFNASTRTPKQDMVSTYVWTAAGGLYSEQTGYVNTIREEFGGLESFSRSIKASIDVAFAIGGPVGAFAEAHYNNNYSRTRNVQKGRSETSAVSLDVAADPDGFLSRYTGGAGAPYNQPSYTAEAVPGKVDNYRFKSFYLAPRTDSFDTFFSQVVDPIWLANSPDARAAALRQAKARRESRGIWRVMHRVTFVSRIPPSFQVYPVDTKALPVPEPASLDQNMAILTLIAQRLGDNAPTASAIGAAINAVFEQDLEMTLPWWKALKEDAMIPNSAAALTWQRLKADTLAYTLQYYETKPAQ